MGVVVKIRTTSKLASALGVEALSDSPSAPRAVPRSDEEPPSVERIIDDVLESQGEDHHFFRPSMLFGCDRANVFHYTHAPSHPQRQDPRMKRILINGTLVHEALQSILANHPEYWFAPESKVHVQVGDALIRGSCDGVLIRRSDGYRWGIEIKSIKHDKFIKLTKPEKGHVFQARIYQRLQKLHWITVLYWDKDTQYLKEFNVPYDADHWGEVRGRVSELKGFIDRRVLPKYDASTCDKFFCQFQDHCRKKGAPV